jgi:hypothetical protein
MAVTRLKCVRWLAAALLLGVALMYAQTAPSGGVVGRLTDLHSKPLGGVTVILRNALTGAETRATTAKNGAYHFVGLTPGEYTLEAESSQLGQGRVDRIEISAGYEARVQTAVQLGSAPATAPAIAAVRESTNALGASVVATAATKPVSPAVSTPAKPIAPVTHISPTMISETREIPTAPAPPITTAMASRPIEAARIETARTGDSGPIMSIPNAAASTASVPVVNAAVVSPEPAVEMAKVTASTLPLMRMLPVMSAVAPQPLAVTPLEPGSAEGAGEMAAAANRVHTRFANLTTLLGALRGIGVVAPVLETPPISASQATLTGEEIRSLPVAGRDWRQFTLDVPPAGNQISGAEGSEFGEETRGASRVLVDGANTRLAFNAKDTGKASETAMGPAGNDAVIHAVEVADQSAAGTGRTNVETRSGGREIHAEASLFSRQSLWGAQNPFSQWAQETTPATPTTVPVFTPVPYTPANHELIWSASVGGPLRRYRMTWFAATQGEERSDPGMATVKHPDDFFAQPTNDEMQVLSARLALSSTNPVVEGLSAYSTMLNTLAGLLGPAPRSTNHWSGFGRLDWNATERHRFMLEGNGTLLDGMGGGLAGSSESYGSHSFGSRHASGEWMLGRWEAFLTPNLLAVTQGSMGREILSQPAETPSPFEQTFNINTWGQLPQMVVDSRYGFTMGNPSRFGTGSYPDEHLFEAQEGVDWVHGKLMVKGGFDLRHSTDATSLLRNHTGTYHYSRMENFISDALVFAQYGIAGELNPYDQHNCDQRGKAWRDSNGQLQGLGYLPCYSWYSQTLGPTEWHLSTNDWAGFATTQWLPAKQLVLTASVRWELEQMPPPIGLVNNPDLPLTQTLPGMGNEFAPRVGLAWGMHEGHWPVLQLGYGMYYGRTGNSVLETALTQTGSANGDLNFFLRPTDNLPGGTGGAPPFPYVLAGEPGAFVKPGAVEFAQQFRNPEIHQAVAGLEETLAGRVRLSVTGTASLARRLPVTVDTNYEPLTSTDTITYSVIDPISAGPIKTPTITVPFYASWPTPTGGNGRLNPNYQQIVQLMSRANSTYEAGTVRLSRTGSKGLSFHVLYTYAHAMDWNPNESGQVSGPSVLDPNNFAQEYGTSNLDMRHSVSAIVLWEAPWRLSGASGRLANGWTLAATGHYHSGLPYTMRVAGSIPEEFLSSGGTIVGLGPGMNGYGGDSRVYGVGRNTYRYPATWKTDMRLGRRFKLPHESVLELMAESFNLFNHQNVTEIETTGYFIEPGTTSGGLPTLNFMTGLETNTTEFGQPLNVNATDFYSPRQIDFGVRFRFLIEPEIAP